jgi:dCMP deaminase
MPDQEILDRAYLKMALEWSNLSKAKRKKVGCLIVKDNAIISDGFNGTISGFDNVCEDEKNKTKKEVLHAESNALAKLATSTNSSNGSTLYLTLSPCFECCKLIIQCKIKKVVYIEEYRIIDGLELLKKAGIEILQIENP